MNNDKPSFKVVDILPFKETEQKKTIKKSKDIKKSNVYSKYMEDSYENSDDSDMTKPI